MSTLRSTSCSPTLYPLVDLQHPAPGRATGQSGCSPLQRTSPYQLERAVRRRSTSRPGSVAQLGRTSTKPLRFGSASLTGVPQRGRKLHTPPTLAASVFPFALPSPNPRCHLQIRGFLGDCIFSRVPGTFMHQQFHALDPDAYVTPLVAFLEP